MHVLPDPRTIDSRPCPALLAPLAQSTTIDQGTLARLAGAVRELLESGDEAGVRELLCWRGPAPLNAAVRRCVQSVLDGPPGEALWLRMFALPVVLVAGSRAATVLPMVLDGTKILYDVFEAGGAFGPARAVTFNVGLVDEAALSALPWVALHRRARMMQPEAAPVDLPAVPLALEGGQAVALRFIAGTQLVPRGAPAFTETAGAIERWGAALTRALAGQLALPGVTLLPLARAPGGVLTALALGRFCREEVAWQLAVGDHLRELQARHGGARAQVRAVAGAIEVEITSPWADDACTHCWRLDDEASMQAVCGSIGSFLQECGVGSVSWDRVAPGH